MQSAPRQNILSGIAENCTLTGVVTPSGQTITDQNPIQIRTFSGSTDFYNCAIECVPLARP